jgi:hypothetical protein
MKFFFRSCLAGILVALLCSVAVAQRKVVVVGRFRIRNVEGKYYGGKKTLAFSHGGKRKLYHIHRDDSGYFMLRLPHGYNSLSGVGYFTGSKHYGLAFPKETFETKLEPADKVFYIGDIILNWEIEVHAAEVFETKDKGLAISGVGSALRKSGYLYNLKEKRSPINVTNEPRTVARFAEQLGMPASDITSSLLHMSKGQK